MKENYIWCVCGLLSREVKVHYVVQTIVMHITHVHSRVTYFHSN